ncbi:hypothetical protein Mal35_20220 [Gimesia maris]|uniref:immunity 22 family protein n=1 Tax=Gimesia maris TaxID=122 RepID=UPI00118AA872|nr:immunity 22 family protein [Gimesia maris]QDT78573.1 hypothetical protein Mal35_20220 [Gimesia maris]
MMRFEKDDKLSLWLFRQQLDEGLEDNLLKDQFGITTFDEDMLEVGGSDEWKTIPLRSVFESMSYSGSWMEAAIARAKELGIEDCKRAFLILNFSYDPKEVQNSIPNDPIFVGVFDYEDDDEF